jgi:hypothetical protein
MMSWFNEKAKKLDALDIPLIEFSAVTFAFWIVMVWPTAKTWVESINPTILLIAAVIFSIRPIYRGYIK